MRLPENWSRIQAEAEKHAVDQTVVEEVLSRVNPAWKLVRKNDDGGMFRRGTIQVILSVARELDDKVWIHVSATERHGERQFSIPSWTMMKRVKDDFLGDKAWAYQVFAPASDHVNINEVLHLWSPLDGKPVLPDFTHGLGSI